MLFSLVFFKVYNCYLFGFPFSVKTYVSVWDLLYPLIFVIHRIILSQNKLFYLAFKDFVVYRNS